MSLDTSNKNFYAIVGLVAAPFLLAGVLGCGVLSITAYRLATEGPGALGHGPAATISFAFLAVSAVGTVLALRSLAIQHRATARLATELHRRRVPPSPTLLRVADDAGIDRLDLVDDTEAYSLTYGFAAPRTVVSTALVDRTNDAELASILAHERYHVTNRDPLKIALARAVTAAFFLLPATGHLLDRYRTSRELDADRRALRRCGRPALAGALLHATGSPTPPLTGVAAAAFGGGDHLLELRITQLETQTEPPMDRVPATSVALTVLGAGAILAGVAATAIAADAPTLFDSRSPGLDLLGGVACAAMWIIAAHALRKRRPHPPTA